MLSRRTFLQSTAAVTSVAIGSMTSASAEDASEPSEDHDRPFCVFTKPLVSLPFDELARVVAAAGFDGIEGPVRPGGHIEPVAAADQLPELAEALARENLTLTILASDINDPADPLTETVLRAAADLGVKRYRMKYFHYDFARPIGDQVRRFAAQLKDLAALNRELGVQALYQNHTGDDYFGGPIWDLAEALDGIDPADIAVAYDVRHAKAESGKSWPIGLHLIADHIGAVFVKDFRWRNNDVVNTPLGDGIVQRDVFDILGKLDVGGPISLHEEYLDHRRPDLVPQHLAAMKKDLATLRKWLK